MGSEQTLAWFRHAELKHGRVAMAAIVGLLVHINGIHFSGSLSPTYGVTFEALSKMGPFEAWNSIPLLGQAQILWTIAGLEHATEWRREQAERIATHQQRFESVMADRPGGFELVAAGAYFGWVRYPGTLATDDALRKLVVDHDVLAIPGTAFTEGDEHMLRISFANLDAEQIDRLGERLAEWSA